MERHEAKEARVIPIILREVDWKGAAFGKLQALPKNAEPVMNWGSRDQAFTDVSKGIRRVVEGFGQRMPSPSSINTQSVTKRPKKTKHQGINPFEYGNPISPDRFYGRESAKRDIKNRIGAISAQPINIVGVWRSGKDIFTALCQGTYR